MSEASKQHSPASHQPAANLAAYLASRASTANRCIACLADFSCADVEIMPWPVELGIPEWVCLCMHCGHLYFEAQPSPGRWELRELRRGELGFLSGAAVAYIRAEQERVVGRMNEGGRQQ